MMQSAIRILLTLKIRVLLVKDLNLFNVELLTSTFLNLTDTLILKFENNLYKMFILQV